MPDRSPAFEAYLKELEATKNATLEKGAKKKAGRLDVTADELLDGANPDLNSEEEIAA